MILDPINSTDFNGELDLNNVGSSVLWSLGGVYDSANIQLRLSSGTSMPAATVTVQISNDGVNYSDFPSGSVTYTSVGYKSTLVVTGVQFLRIVVTTEAGSAGERLVPTLSVERDDA